MHIHIILSHSSLINRSVIIGINLQEYIFRAKLYDSMNYINVYFASRYFLSHLIADCILGYFYYPGEMNNLAGYPHHFVYMIVIMMINMWNYNYELILYFVIEFSTIVYSYQKIYRKSEITKLVYFYSFLITRIIYFFWISVIFTKNDYGMSYLTYIVLQVHIKWFFQLCDKM